MTADKTSYALGNEGVAGLIGSADMRSSLSHVGRVFYDSVIESIARGQAGSCGMSLSGNANVCMMKQDLEPLVDVSRRIPLLSLNVTMGKYSRKDSRKSLDISHWLSYRCWLRPALLRASRRSLLFEMDRCYSI